MPALAGAGGGVPGSAGRGAASARQLTMTDAVVPAGDGRVVEVTERTIFDPLTNSRFFWQVVRHFGLFAGLYVAADIGLGILAAFLGIVGLGALGALKLWWILDFLIAIGLTIVAWLMPVPALLEQYSKLVRDHADSHQDVLAYIRQIMTDHQTPCDSLRPRSMAPPGDRRREYLEMRSGVFTGVISCFPHGRDLYVGWTFWIRLSPLRVVLMFVGRKIQNWTGRGDDMHQTLRYESVRADVDAMHSSVAEAIASLESWSGTGDRTGMAGQEAADRIREPSGGAGSWSSNAEA